MPDEPVIKLLSLSRVTQGESCKSACKIGTCITVAGSLYPVLCPRSTAFSISRCVAAAAGVGEIGVTDERFMK